MPDRRLLEKWRSSTNKRKWEKAVAILDSEKLTTKNIAEKIERPLDLLRRWIKDFNTNGLSGIDIQPRVRRSSPEKIRQMEERKRTVLEILHQRPAEFGINRSNWTLNSIAEAYAQRCETSISGSLVGRILKSAGHGIRKARKVLTSSDPEYREKVDLLLKTLHSLSDQELFFFIDELGPLRVKKYGGRAYTPKGVIKTIPQNQTYKGAITLYGALSATTNQVSWCYGASKDTQAMIDLIEILYNQFHSKTKSYVTWDAASWHRSRKLLEWLDGFNYGAKAESCGPTIELVPLPTNAQFLDVIEAVFSGMKRAVIHHSDYQTECDMKTAISRHFVERNEYFRKNPQRAGKKIWDIDFFNDFDRIKSGDYREW